MACHPGLSWPRRPAVCTWSPPSSRQPTAPPIPVATQEAQTRQVPESPPAPGGVALGLSSPSLPAASGAVSVWTVTRP